MIKYSLALLTAAAVVFSAGCDGACCGTPAPTAVILGLTAGQSVTTDSFTLSDGGSHDNNDGGSVTTRSWTVDGQDAQAGDVLSSGSHEVCLLVTDNDGLTNQTCGTVIIGTDANPTPVARITAPSTCTPGAQVDISGTNSSDDGTIASYSWTPTSITGDSGEITCPATGSTTVCLTVTDDASQSSSQVCKTITATVATCPTPVITASDDSNGNATVEGMNYGRTYYLGYQNALDNCEPAKTCTWTVRSMKADGSVNVGDCFDFQDGDHGVQSGEYIGTWIKLCDNNVNYPYANIEVNLTCAGMDTVSKTFAVTVP